MKKWHWLIIGAILLLSIVAELFFVHHEAHHWWNAIPAFFTFFGALGSLGLIVLCKFVLIHLIAKHEAYYDAP